MILDSRVRPGVKLRVAAYDDRQRLARNEIHSGAAPRSLTSVDRTCAVAFSTLSILSAEILHRARLDLSLHLRSQTCQQDKPPEHYLAVRVMESWSGHPRPSSPRSGPLALGRRCAGRYRPIRHVITYAQVFVRACRSPHACVRFTGLSRHAHVLCVRHSRGFACASV